MATPFNTTEFSQRREAIGAALTQLEDALSRPASVGGEWATRVRDAIEDLRRVGTAQVEALTGEDSPLTAALEEVPHLGQRVTRLTEDLPMAITAIDKLLIEWDSLDPTEIRRRLLPIMGETLKLRQAVADLMWDAYSHDVGGPG